MRMVKMKQNHITLEACVKKFLLVKEAQHTGEEAMRDYRNCLARFIAHSHNSLDYSVLENDVLSFFSAIPDTSPARYNKPFQNVNAFLNWLVEQGYLSQSPIKAHKLHKRQDEEKYQASFHRRSEGISEGIGQEQLHRPERLYHCIANSGHWNSHERTSCIAPQGLFK